MSETVINAAHDWSKPYIFISYTHSNDAIMKKLFTLLQNAGYRVWYDEYIPKSINWRDNLAACIRQCTHFIAIINKEYLTSDDCKAELNKALQKPKLTIENNEYSPITPLFCEGTTMNNLPEGFEMYLSLYQYCSLARDEELNENSKCFQDIIRNANIARCKIAEEQSTIPSSPEDNIPTPERAKAHIPCENLPDMTTYMVSSALADRIHNAALTFSDTDEKAGFDLYKAAFSARKSLVDQEPDSEKENSKLSDLCSDIKDFACGHNIDAGEIFGA